MNYNLKYDFDPINNCGLIHFNDKNVMMDFSDLFSIINFEKNFIYYDEEKLYPYYLRHNKKISYLDHIFKYDDTNIKYVFKNNNQFDLRRENINIYHEYHDKIISEYNVIDYNLGHYTEIGKDAYIVKNPLWFVNDDNKNYILMYCEKNTIVKICKKSLDKIIEYEKEHNKNKKITFFKMSNGYIGSSTNLFIHQIITGCYGNGQGTKNISVDHIDRDPLNNCWDNLKIATREEQEKNCKGIMDGTKRARKSNAKPLPDGITQDMMRKYVVYYEDYADKEKKRLRQYFKIEKHPKLNKIFIGNKSNKISILEKLNQINKIVDDLEKDIYPSINNNNETIQLPKYYSLIITREKPHLVFEKRVDSKRLNVRMILQNDYDLNEQLTIIKQKIKDKYGDIDV